jgi:hypothetical protein
MVPGNNMKPYGGLASADDRAKVIVFLQSLSKVNNSFLTLETDASRRRRRGD